MTEIKEIRPLEKVGAIWLKPSKFEKGKFYLSMKIGNKNYVLNDFGRLQKNNRPNYSGKNGVAGWLNRSKKGNEYITFRVKLENGNSERYVAFKNSFKKNEKQPDYIVYK